MDMIFDIDREKYLGNLYSLQNRVNPKPFSNEVREQIIQSRIQGREVKIMDERKEMIEFQKDIKDLSIGNLKILAKSFEERSDEDPSFEWKAEICQEVLEKKLERDFEMDR